MKKSILTKNICALILVGLFLSGCKKYDEFQSNPNQASAATPALLLTGISYSVFYKDNTTAAYATRHLTYYERGNSGVDYSWREGGFTNYDILRQVMRMDSLAKIDNQQQYYGITKFFRALLFAQLTEDFGDIPYRKALEGLAGNFTPEYDTQESVYAGILQELEEANTLLDDNKGKINGDIIYGGVASKWKKLVNAFRLRLLIHLSKKEANATLNIKSQFQSIINDPAKYPLFTSNADNAQLVFNATAPNNYYPDFGYLSLATLVSMEKGFVKILKDRQDPRLFAFAEPIGGGAPNNFNNYEGVDAGLTISDQFNASGNASRIKSRYHDDRINEPLIFLGYAEQEFLVAEAISRGWIAGDAKLHYENGITASMKFYGISDAEINAYLTKPLVAFSAPNALNLITIQKHIAFFMNSGWEAFFEQRRTGMPTLSVGPGTYNDQKVPKRWIYPQSEYDYNAANLDAAVKRQFNGDDDVNAVIWLLQ
jgi:hypothetical protein